MRFDKADEDFLTVVLGAVHQARLKGPWPYPILTALNGEVDALALALLHIREDKYADWRKVYVGAVQVAVMAMRAATEGDATIGAVPTPENCARQPSEPTFGEDAGQ